MRALRAVVTGGATNIGRAITESFLAAGGRVVVGQLNTGITFSRSKLLVKANATLGTTVQGAPIAASALIPVGTSNYTSPNTTIDVSFEYRLSKRVSLYGSARNVTQNNLQSRIAAPNTPDYARMRVTQRFGSLVTLGVKGEF